MTCVLLIDDHGAMRDGLALLLRRAMFSAAGSTGDAERGVALAAARSPDVIVLDPNLDLGDEDESIWLARLRQAAPSARILFYTETQEPGALERELAADAEGLVLKTCSATELVGAVRAVAGGRRYVDPRVAQLLCEAPGDDLSCREREILGLLAAGLTGEQAAERLFLSPETIRTHVRNAMRKLGATTRARAVVIALKTGRISAEVEGPIVQDRSARWHRPRGDAVLVGGLPD